MQAIFYKSPIFATQADFYDYLIFAARTIFYESPIFCHASDFLSLTSFAMRADFYNSPVNFAMRANFYLYHCFFTICNSVAAAKANSRLIVLA
jgi:hypothetical protein